MSELFIYRVRPGFIFGKGTDEETHEGETVTLTKEAAAPLSDVLELYQFDEPVPSGPADVTEPDSEGQPPEEEELDLSSLTVARLKELPAWESVPEPKPTRKADIIKAIQEVM